MKTITKTLILIVMMTATNQGLLAQTSKKYKVIQINKRSEAINVSAEKLWEIIGPGFEEAGYWSTAVDHSVGSGTAMFEGATCDLRSCDLNAKGFSKIKEKLTIYDATKQELAYDVVEGMPGFVVRGNNLWKVVSLGDNRSALEMTITMETKKFMGMLMGGMMKGQMKKVIPTIFHDLKVYAETGAISEEKKQRMVKLETKNAKKKA